MDIKRVVYLRVSTEKQEEDMQRNAIKNYLKNLGIDYNTCLELKDLGISGTHTNRPDYQRLMGMMIEEEVQEIYSYEYSRLWRDLEDQNRCVKMAMSLDILICSVVEGQIITIEDKFKANVLGSVNELEAARTRKRIMDGIAAKKKAIEEGLDIWVGRGKDKKQRKLRGSPNDKKNDYL